MQQIDTRFLAKPNNIIVPLYPFFHNLNIKPILYNNYSSGMLHKKIASFFGLSHKQIVLGNSATDVFLLFLSELLRSRNIIKVALPIFFCPQFTFLVAKTNVNIFLFEINKEFAITERSINRIVEEKCDLVVCPHFFGARNMPEKAYKFFLDRSIIVVLDEAQSFPLSNSKVKSHDNVVRLFSFGKNKPVSGFGGGGMAFNNMDLVPNCLSMQAGSSIFQDCNRLFRTKFARLCIKNSEFLYKYFYLPETRIDIFLEKRFKSMAANKGNEFKKISFIQEKIAYYNWLYLENNIHFL